MNQQVSTAFGEPVAAVVTGGSRGIGRALVARLLADPGVTRVFALSRHASDDFSAVDTGRLRALDVDVTSEPAVRTAFAQIAQETAEIRLVFNCAGILHEVGGMAPEKRLVDIDPDHVARSFAVNATGLLLVAKHAQPLLPRGGRIVFASLSARVGSIADNRLGGWYGYRASKAAQNMIVRNLAIELRRRSPGIICVALHPGTVDTTLSQPFQRNVPAARLFSPDEAARRLLTVIDGLGEDDNGGFFAWDGQPIPW